MLGGKQQQQTATRTPRSVRGARNAAPEGAPGVWSQQARLRESGADQRQEAAGAMKPVVKRRTHARRRLWRLCSRFSARAPRAHAPPTPTVSRDVRSRPAAGARVVRGRGKQWPLAPRCSTRSARRSARRRAAHALRAPAAAARTREARPGVSSRPRHGGSAGGESLSCRKHPYVANRVYCDTLGPCDKLGP